MRDRANVEATLARVATYLGHLHQANTYWHLSAAPEQLELARDGSVQTSEPH